MNETLWLIIYDGKLLFADKPDGEATGGQVLPRAAQPPLPVCGEIMPVGELQNLPCRAAVFSGELPPGWLALDLFEVNKRFGRELYLKAGRAAQLAYWQKNSRFCPVCATETAPHHAAPAMACPSCGKLMFPKPTAAVLVLVEKGDSLLLVKAHNFRSDFYGLVAGFLDQGESLEDCCRREVMEETSLSIENLRYFASEPWPFPNNIMIGFTAQYAGGEIRLQEDELKEAAFFKRSALPRLPENISLTRRMIDWWAQGGKNA